MSYQQKTQRGFNKIFSSFLKDVKEVNDDLRKKIKQTYKVIDKTSGDYCDLFVANVIPHMPEILNDNFMLEAQLCKDITMKEVFTAVSNNESEEKMMKNYLFTLMLFAYMSTLEEEDELLAQVIKVLGFSQEGMTTEFTSDVEDIIDDDVKALLVKINECGVTSKAQVNMDDPSSLLGALGNSKIANLAKEISQDIDVSALKAENPEDMIKNMLNFGSSNNVLGNIIQKVSTTLNDKISNGEIRHDELLGEAMSMMNMFGGEGNPFMSNPLFSQMMKGMKSGKAQMRTDVAKKADARDRLRKKLETRKKNVE